MLRQRTPYRVFVVLLGCLLQDVPPLLVPRMVPLMPTARQMLVLAQLTALRLLVVPLVFLLQVVPPLVVTRMVPLAPTTSQTLVLVQAMARRLLVVPLVWLVHWTIVKLIDLVDSTLPAWSVLW